MKAKIFVISQDNEVVKQISAALEQEGHMITAIDAPKTVPEQCQKEKVDLVFLDVYIRDSSYDKLIKEIKKVSPDTEVVLVTSYAFPESMAKGQVLDIQGYLIKPLSVDKVKHVMARALRQSELARENRRLLLTVTAAKKEWEATVDAIEDPIFVTDFDYKILRANLATFQALSKGVNEVIGHKCYELLHCAHHPLDYCPGKVARDSGEPASDTIAFKGLKERLHCSVYPQVFATGGGLVHYLRTPLTNMVQQAETMTKYERLFDDARIPILFITSEDYKVTDANQRAIELFGYDPEELFDMDLENLFAPTLRETVINNIMQQLENKEPPLRTKILNKEKKEIDIFVIANPIEINKNIFIQIFTVPVDLLSGIR